MEQFCDSLCQRLTSQISDRKVIDEINFSYNMQMSYRYQNSDKVEKYITKALEIKDNFVDANKIMENYLFRKFNSIHEPYALLDSINNLEIKYEFKNITPLFKEYKLIASKIQLVSATVFLSKIKNLDFLSLKGKA
jgi:hypothetical protein